MYQRNRFDEVGTLTDLERRALTGELSQEERQELEERNVLL